MEENDIRQGLTPWDRGRTLIVARDSGAGTLDAALLKLYPHADRRKRSRLRILAEVFDRDDTLAVLLCDLDLALLVFLIDRDFLFGLDPGQFGLLLLLLLDLVGLGLLARLHRGDFAGLLGLGIGLLPLELQDGFAGFDVLLLGVFFGVASKLVGLNGLGRRDLGDLPDTAGVEDVVVVPKTRRGSARDNR